MEELKINSDKTDEQKKKEREERTNKYLNSLSPEEREKILNDAYNFFSPNQLFKHQYRNLTKYDFIIPQITDTDNQKIAIESSDRKHERLVNSENKRNERIFYGILSVLGLIGVKWFFDDKEKQREHERLMKDKDIELAKIQNKK